MRKKEYCQGILTATAIVFMLSLVAACSNQDLPTQLSGTWQRSQGGGTVAIDLVHEPPVLTVDGTPYHATIAKIDDGAHSIHLTVQTVEGQTEEWILHQVWNDNGSDFTLAFIHNGTREDLSKKSS